MIVLASMQSCGFSRRTMLAARRRGVNEGGCGGGTGFAIPLQMGYVSER